MSAQSAQKGKQQDQGEAIKSKKLEPQQGPLSLLSIDEDVLLQIIAACPQDSITALSQVNSYLRTLVTHHVSFNSLRWNMPPEPAQDSEPPPVLTYAGGVVVDQTFWFPFLAATPYLYSLDINSFVWSRRQLTVVKSDDDVSDWEPLVSSVAYCRGYLWIFGGRKIDQHAVSDDLWRIDPDKATIEKITPTVGGKQASGSSKQSGSSSSSGSAPRGRHQHTINSFHNRYLIIFGGLCANSLGENDTFVFDTEKMAWTQPMVTGSVPLCRFSHSACFAEDRYLYVFGGSQIEEPLNVIFDDLYRLDCNTWLWEKFEPPERWRYGQQARQWRKMKRERQANLRSEMGEPEQGGSNSTSHGASMPVPHASIVTTGVPPLERFECGMVALRSHKLVIFGGMTILSHVGITTEQGDLRSTGGTGGTEGTSGTGGTGGSGETGATSSSGLARSRFTDSSMESNLNAGEEMFFDDHCLYNKEILDVFDLRTHHWSRVRAGGKGVRQAFPQELCWGILRYSKKEPRGTVERDNWELACFGQNLEWDKSSIKFDFTTSNQSFGSSSSGGYSRAGAIHALDVESGIREPGVYIGAPGVMLLQAPTDEYVKKEKKRSDRSRDAKGQEPAEQDPGMTGLENVIELAEAVPHLTARAGVAIIKDDPKSMHPPPTEPSQGQPPRADSLGRQYTEAELRPGSGTSAFGSRQGSGHASIASGNSSSASDVGQSSGPRRAYAVDETTASSLLREPSKAKAQARPQNVSHSGSSTSTSSLSVLKNPQVPFVASPMLMDEDDKDAKVNPMEIVKERESAERQPKRRRTAELEAGIHDQDFARSETMMIHATQQEIADIDVEMTGPSDDPPAPNPENLPPKYGQVGTIEWAKETAEATGPMSIRQQQQEQELAAQKREKPALLLFMRYPDILLAAPRSARIAPRQGGAMRMRNVVEKRDSRSQPQQESRHDSDTSIHMHVHDDPAVNDIPGLRIHGQADEVLRNTEH